MRNRLRHRGLRLTFATFGISPGNIWHRLRNVWHISSATFGIGFATFGISGTSVATFGIPICREADGNGRSGIRIKKEGREDVIVEGSLGRLGDNRAVGLHENSLFGLELVSQVPDDVSFGVLDTVTAALGSKFGENYEDVGIVFAESLQKNNMRIQFLGGESEVLEFVYDAFGNLEIEAVVFLCAFEALLPF